MKHGNVSGYDICMSRYNVQPAIFLGPAPGIFGIRMGGERRIANTAEMVLHS